MSLPVALHSFIAGMVLLGISGTLSAENPVRATVRDQRPNPTLSPAEVVKTVVTALRNNNSPLPNAGVFITYQFASPANRAVTGPYGHFLRIVKPDEFLFSKYAEEYEEIVVKGDQAEQTIHIRLDAGPVATYKFNVSRQKEGACVGCWMIDGVQRLP